MHNNSTNVEYDNIVIYSVSLAKIRKDSKIELERALKLISELDLTPSKNDKSSVIKGAVDMIEGFDKSDIAMMKRDAKRKEEFEQGYLLESAHNRGVKETLENNIKTMHNNGADIEMISKLLNLDIEFVKEVLNK